MADDDSRPPGGGGPDRRWVFIGLAVGGAAFVWVWWRNRGASSSSSTDTAAPSSAVDSAGGTSAPTDLRDIVQINERMPPAEDEDNQPTHAHKPVPDKGPRPRRKRHARQEPALAAT